MSDDPFVARLRKLGLPVTRKQYIALATLGQDNYDWTVEDEEGLPEELQDFDALEADDATDREPDGQTAGPATR